MATPHTPIPTVEELGSRLKELRKREDLTVHDIARRAKVRDQDVVAFEEEGRIEGELLVKLIGMISADRSLDGAFREIAKAEPDLQSLPGILDCWSAGQIDNREAIKLARLEDYADLLATRIENGVPLPTTLTDAERASAARFAAMEF